MLNEKEGTTLKVHKIDTVDFTINQTSSAQSDFNLVWKEGDLYLSLTNIILSDGNKWYELPIKDLKSVHIIDEKPVKIQFRLPSVDIIVTGKYAVRLLALKHFLMPYITPQKESEAHDNLKNLIKFWSLDIQDISQLSKLLSLSPEDTKKLIETAREKDLITPKGDLTPQAYDLFSSEEKKMLKDLEVKNE
jgi:hypothetical protein